MLINRHHRRPGHRADHRTHHRMRRLAVTLALAMLPAAALFAQGSAQAAPVEAEGTVAGASAPPVSDPTPPSSPPRAEVVYDSIPADLPPNVTSLGYQATGTSEFGDEVGLTGAHKRKLRSVEVVLSSWACESGRWNTNDCRTTAGATFSHPVTVTVFAVDNSGPTPVPGALLASQTQLTEIPYRPSADPVNCTGPNAGRWYDATTGGCYNGIAHPVTFTFDGSTTLPDEVIWTVSFNTTGYGDSPIGTGAPCYSTVQGCPYDALNVGVQGFPGSPYVGVDIDPDGVFLDSANGSSYCDGGAAGTGFLRLDSPCWTDLRPLATITAGKPHGKK
ncbi:hypothetical protein [Streptomyces sp. NBRC 109706]|uniref:hypothetical protein n=1 Tax=Streptomyces sp. NBRC 109706 TaxID=1550035 RepID=UPI000784D907|nr:hypothetical protein [Streptomyces sp. NBRC 109706]